MAEHCTTQRDYTKAITFYKEALVYNENDGKVCMHCASTQENWSLRFSASSDINQLVQPQKKARSLKFWVNGEGFIKHS